MRSERFTEIADLLREHLFSDELVKAMLSGVDPRSEARWLRIVMRPVLLSGRRLLQVERYDAKRSETANIDSSADAVVQEVLDLPFRHLTIQLVDRRIQARITKRGKMLVKVVAEVARADLRHDRGKRRWVREDAGFLELLGMAGGGKVYPAHQRKYRQINEFVRAIAEAPNFNRLCVEPVRLIDFGCGNAYLTFAAYHFLSAEMGLKCEMVGVDRDTEAISRNRRRSASLGWPGLRFEHGDIRDVSIEDSPSIALALHACDTATDDAIARAVACKAELILVAPCCHHHIQNQLTPAGGLAGAEVIMHSDVLRERLGDVLTDGARMALLGLVGYQARILQFATLTDSSKNLLIRAVRTGRRPTPTAVTEYEALKSAWRIAPYLEEALG